MTMQWPEEIYIDGRTEYADNPFGWERNPDGTFGKINHELAHEAHALAESDPLKVTTEHLKQIWIFHPAKAKYLAKYITDARLAASHPKPATTQKEEQMTGEEFRAVIAKAVAEELTKESNLEQLSTTVIDILNKATKGLRADFERLQKRVDDPHPLVSHLATQSASFVSLETAKQMVEPLRAEIVELRSRLAGANPVVDLLTDQIKELRSELAHTRDRVASAEVRPLTPGAAGTPGADGKDGRPGADGVGYDDLSVELASDERTVVVKAARGERVKEVGRIQLPLMIYRGVWIPKKEYARGDVVTYAGSSWCAEENTSDKPDDVSLTAESRRGWRLAVKKGAAGRDLRPDDPKPSLPIVRTAPAKPTTVFSNRPEVSQ